MKDYKAEIEEELQDRCSNCEIEDRQRIGTGLICIQCRDKDLLNKLIEARQEIENEKSENERLIKDGQYLIEQINLKDIFNERGM